MNKVEEQYNLESINSNEYTGERKMILDLLDINYNTWVYQEASNSIAYEVKDYILKAELEDVLKNLEDYGVTASLTQVLEVIKNR